MVDLNAPDGTAFGERPFVMGVLNITPDSFSDGGKVSGEAAIEHARAMVEAGADIIDVGAESTRPGSDPIPASEERRRLKGILEEVIALDARVSIDTTKATIAAWALDVGAAMVNDVSACRFDPDMAPLVSLRGVPVVLMHMLGMPKTMQDEPTYTRGVVVEITEFFQERMTAVTEAGVKWKQIILDPGIGFGKTVDHNLTILRDLGTFKELGFPIMVGTSRKWFIGRITGRPVDDRLGGSLAAATAAVMNGADILRVHDVAETVQAVKVAQAIAKGKWP